MNAGKSGFKVNIASLNSIWDIRDPVSKTTKIETADKNLKKYLTSLTTREVRIKTALGFHFTTVTVPTIKTTHGSAGKDVEKEEPAYCASGKDKGSVEAREEVPHNAIELSDAAATLLLGT